MCTPTGDETCAGTADEDCDGTECGLWGRLYGDGSIQYPRAIEVAPNGDVYLVGSLGTSIQFAGATVSADAVNDQFLAKLSPTGQELWIKKLPSGGGTTFFTIIGASNTSVIVDAALDDATIDLGGGPLASDGWGDQAFAAFSSDGVYQWSTTLTAPGDLFASSYTEGFSASLNEVVLAGYAPPGAVYDGTIFIDPASTEDRNWYGLAFDAATGEMLWHRDFVVGELENNNSITSLAIDSAGEVYLTGSTSSPVSFGGPPIPDGDWTSGFVAHLDADGNWVDGGRTGDNTYPDQIAIGPGGEIIVSSYLDFYQFMGMPVPFQPSNVVMRLSPSYQPVWAQFMNEQISIDVGADGIGFVLGNNVPFEVGGATFSPKGTIDLVAGKIDMNGVMKWYRQFGAPGASVDDASPWKTFKLDPDGRELILFQSHGASVDFGFGPVGPSSGYDIGIVQLAP